MPSVPPYLTSDPAVGAALTLAGFDVRTEERCVSNHSCCCVCDRWTGCELAPLFVVTAREGEPAEAFAARLARALGEPRDACQAP